MSLYHICSIIHDTHIQKLYTHSHKHTESIVRAVIWKIYLRLQLYVNIRFFTVFNQLKHVINNKINKFLVIPNPNCTIVKATNSLVRVTTACKPMALFIKVFQ